MWIILEGRRSYSWNVEMSTETWRFVHRLPLTYLSVPTNVRVLRFLRLH